MKKLIFCLILVLLSTTAYAAEYSVKIPASASMWGTDYVATLNTVCINGYMFLITTTPAISFYGGAASPGISTIQMYERNKGSDDNGARPMRCGNGK